MSSVRSSVNIKMPLKTILITVIFFGILCEGAVWGPDKGEDQCETAIKETMLEDRSTIVDETGSRLHSTWLSQECEVRAGPEYVIRKYTFFDNGTFLLLRHHYAEESCSVAMYTVSARGVIRLLSSSSVAPGATDARYQLDRVHIVPLTRQVAQKFSHRVNVSCTPQPKWRPYVPQLIYEQPSSRLTKSLWEGPTYNAFQRNHPPSRKHRGLDCLEPLGIEFGELRLVRVQKKSSSSSAFALGSNGTPRIELLLGSLPPNVYAKKTHRPTSLQPTPLLRADTTQGCLVCGAISRGIESSPPVLHEVAALPALLGGFWLSPSCESCEGGLWIKRQLAMYAGDMLWTGRWDYYADPRCTIFLYAVTAAGSYIQRAGRQRRHGEIDRDPETFLDPANTDNSQGQRGQEYHTPKRFFRTKRNIDEKISIENRKRTIEKVDLNDQRLKGRSKKALAEWMTPELARKLFEIYSSKKEITESMLPTVEEIYEAIGRSSTKKKFDSSTPNDVKEEANDYKFTDDWKIDPSSSSNNGKSRRSLEGEDSFRYLLQNAQPAVADAYAAMLRGNQRREETTKKPMISPVPAGTTELDLHVAESLLIAGDLSIAARCGAQILGDDREVGSRGLRVRPLSTWPRSCVQHALEAPSTLGLRARVGVNWSGQYTLLLGPRDDHLWEAPLHQCGPTPSHNPSLRAHLRRSVGLRYGLYTSSAPSEISDLYLLILLSTILLFFGR